MGHDPVRWAQVQDALADVLAHPPDERSLALNQYFDRDPTLRDELERLVASSDAADSYFQELGERLSSATPGSTADSWSREIERLLEVTDSGGSTPTPSTAEDGSLVQDVHFCTTSDGVGIAYATSGSGPPLVKVANWLSHLEFDAASPVWRHWLTDLSRDHTLIRYDERGCGLSDWDVEFSFDAWVEDLESVVDHLGLERFPLLGISQGGPVAIAYSVRHPERVSHLILYGAYALGWANRDLDEETRAAFEAQIALSAHGWGQRNPAYRQLFTSLFMPGATAQQAEWFNELQRVSTSPENAVRFQRQFAEIDVTDLMPQVTTPTLVLHSRKDYRVPFEMGREIASAIPGSRFVALNSENHLILEHEEAWPHFLREVRRFLGVDTAERTSPARTRPAHPVGDGRFAGPVLDPLARRLGARLSERFRILRQVGSGGMATIYEAVDVKHDRPVAVKVLNPAVSSSIDPKRFEREIHVTSKLVHPNILPLLDSGNAEGILYYVTPMLGEGSLKERMALDAPLSVEEAVSITRDVAAALSYAHRAGVIHRDVKPANILLADGRALLADFGVARVASGATHDLTRAGSVVGTLKYISPEQLRGVDAVGPSADIYSLGCVAYELLCGRPPFEGPAEELIYKHLHESPRQISKARGGVPPAVCEAVNHALAKSPEDRPASADQFAVELARAVAQAGLVPGAPGASIQAPSSRARVRHPLPRGVLFGAAATAALAAVVFVRGCV